MCLNPPPQLRKVKIILIITSNAMHIINCLTFQTTMPKHFRKCDFCTNGLISNPTVVFFSTSDNLKRVLNIPQESACLICEEHFQPSNLKSHGSTKRLRDGAHPEFFPRQDAVMLDHAYVQTGPLDLVRLQIIEIQCDHIKNLLKGFLINRLKYVQLKKC